MLTLYLYFFTYKLDFCLRSKKFAHKTVVFVWIHLHMWHEHDDAPGRKTVYLQLMSFAGQSAVCKSAITAHSIDPNKHLIHCFPLGGTRRGPQDVETKKSIGLTERRAGHEESEREAERVEGAHLIRANDEGPCGNRVFIPRAAGNFESQSISNLININELYFKAAISFKKEAACW